MKLNNQTWTEFFDQVPPFFCFAVARDTTARRPALADIVKGSGLNKRTFQRIARRISWSGVKVSQVDKFCVACKVNHSRLSELKDYIAKTLNCKRPLKHLSPRQLKDFEIQCARWKAAKL